MCGLSGFIPSQKLKSSNLTNISSSMIDALVHRGPDAYGNWIEDNNKLVLGFRRLAIQDLSSAGNQPMQSNSNRFVIIFNGEIYNHLEIRKEIDLHVNENFKWKGSSDTETILESIELWGIDGMLKRLHGMFSFAVFDKKLDRLTLARDRMGEKPLYFGTVNNSFVFASELKAIKRFPNFNNAICRKSLAKYLQYNFIPSPLSIYQNIYKLNPGSIVEINILSESFQCTKQRRFWQIKKNENSEEILDDSEETIQILEKSLKKVIKNQMLSDVPLGAFLSGGVDSSLIVSLMQSCSLNKVKTFTIGFEDNIFDESPHAKLIANHLNTDHTEMILDSKSAQNVIYDLPYIYDEPFADSSQIPTYLVSKIAKQKVTVALSGDGGDEIFGGYNRYIWAPRIWKNINLVPVTLRPLLLKVLNSFPKFGLLNLQNFINITQSKAGGIQTISNKFTKFQRLIQSSSQKNFYNNLLSQWPDLTLLVQGINSDDLIFEEEPYENFPENQFFSDNFVTSMMDADSVHYLPDDVLCKVDRASMANSLETRAPFLDHELIELARRLPNSLLINNGVGKIALRKILYKYVPKQLIERPKTGFSIPIADWLRGPLREWAEDNLSESRIKSEGYLNQELISLIWQEHISGRYDWSDRLWGVLMFESWLKDN
jgi:asparagine synthase (glutamine-hydrolysing)